jgi:hypothetical protein
MCILPPAFLDLRPPRWTDQWLSVATNSLAVHCRSRR